MPRQKKEAKSLNIKLAANIHDLLEQFCEETGMTKTTAVEKILRQYFEGYFKKAKEERKLF